jgi:hypothetical protein
MGHFFHDKVKVLSIEMAQQNHSDWSKHSIWQPSITEGCLLSNMEHGKVVEVEIDVAAALLLFTVGIQSTWVSW